MELANFDRYLADSETKELRGEQRASWMTVGWSLSQLRPAECGTLQVGSLYPGCADDADNHDLLDLQPSADGEDTYHLWDELVAAENALPRMLVQVPVASLHYQDWVET